MPPVQNARRTLCPIPIPNMSRSWISERALFWIYEHAQCGVFERTCLQRAYVIPCWQQMGSSTVLRARRSMLVPAASMRCMRWAHSIGWGCCVRHPYFRYGNRGRRQNVSPPSVLFEWSRIFYNTQETQMPKMITRILKFEFCDFWEFFWNFQQGIAWSLCGRCGPLWSRPN